MRFGEDGWFGRILISSFEHVDKQEHNPVSNAPLAMAVLGIDMAIAGPKPRRISADSFRKLTFLLKKDVQVPSFAPLPVPLSAPEPPQVEALPPVILLEVHPEIEVAPLPEPEPEPIFELAPEPLLEPAPVETVVAEPIIAEPIVVEAAYEAPVEIQPEIQSPAPPPQPKIQPRPKLRDAFSQTPSMAPARAPVEVVQQTPEQEMANAELARSLLDMMASSNSTGLPQERALAADTLLRMLPKLPLKSLIMLSERLCLMDAPPQLLVAKLIGDPRIEVSGPLLENCSHISDEVLVAVIHEGMPDKRRMMARRRKLNRAVSAVLVQTGEASTLLTLVRNMGAEIAHETFIKLVKYASQSSDLLAPLCTRADLPVPFAFELFWYSPAQLRRYLLSRFLTDSETLTKILKITLDGDAGDKAFPSPERVKAALLLAAEGKHDDAAVELANCANLNAETASRILADPQGEPLAAVLKAMGVPRSAANEIFNGAVTTILDHARDPEELQSLFDSLSFNKARILITYWDWACLQSGPYAPLN